MNPVPVTIFGAGGRMGAKNLAAVLAAPALRLVGAVDREGNPAVGLDAGLWAGRSKCGVLVGSDLACLRESRVAVDFTAPAATLALLESAPAELALVIGTTGFDAAGLARIREAAKKRAIVFSGNYSLGVNVLLDLVRKASGLLAEYDLEVVEHHHNQKKDAPSGTAIMLAKAAAAGRDWTYEETAVQGRSGEVGARPKKEIGMHAVRGGGIVGHHEVLLVGETETIRLTHTAHAREAFTSGVVRAAAWVAGRSAGLYSMTDVLGLG